MRLHEPDSRAIDQVFRLRGQRAMNRHHVRPREELVERDGLSAVLSKRGFVDVGIGGQQFDFPGCQKLGDSAPDPPETDDAERDSGIAVLARTEVGTLEIVAAPAA